MIILLVVGVVFIHMCLMWLWYRASNNPSVIDVGWASALTLSGLVYLNHQSVTTRSLVLSLILLIWGLRLGLYLLLTRVRQGLVDKRYTALSRDWQIAKSLGFFLNFQLQGVFVCIISLPWYFAALTSQNSPSILDYFALFLAALFISLEQLADHQLQEFKRQRSGGVCNTGLWQYSRHPNYFFEWLVWCAFTLFALPSDWGWIAVLSPLTLYLLMTKVTGPMTEQGSIESKGQLYLDYQKVTPMFFPKI